MSDEAWKTLRENYRRVWQEDDAAPDAECIYDAWRRLFGVPLCLEESLSVVDGGDCTAHMMSDGRVALTSYRGNAEIRVLS